MWTYELSAETDVDLDALWRTWVDVGTWPDWNGGVVRVEIDGPFAVGTTFRMVPPDDDPIPMRLVAVEPGRGFTDEFDDGHVVVTTEHRLDPVDGDRTRVTYRTTITGPAADEVAPTLGPAITADFPDVLAALIATAASPG